MRKWFIGLLLVLIALPACGQTISPQDKAALTSVWRGRWLARNFVYDAELHITVDDQGNTVDGYIKWTLRQTPRPAEQNKIGLTGTEYVRGVYFPTAHLVRMDGYQLDDSNGVIGLDKYRLVLSDDGAMLGGITWDHGSWLGQFQLKRR